MSPQIVRKLACKFVSKCDLVRIPTSFSHRRVAERIGHVPSPFRLSTFDSGSGMNCRYGRQNFITAE
jgi:hypothetical protein